MNIKTKQQISRQTPETFQSLHLHSVHKRTFSSCATEDNHATMSQWVPGGCVSTGDVGGCYVLRHGRTQAVRLWWAPVHCRCGGYAICKVAHRDSSATDATAASTSLLQVIVQTQRSALWRILHYPYCWLAGRVSSHARQRVAIVVTRHHGYVLAIVYTLRHVAGSSSLVNQYFSIHMDRI